MSYGPNPWQQLHWDARAAGNFIGGGVGSGLLVATALAGASGAARVALVLGALALVGFGLLCVWAEIGRPLRAFNVYLNPRTSWMSREALIAAGLFPLAAAGALFWPAGLWLAALAAVVFLYCQGWILRAARGIPAWREPVTVALIVATGLTEGLGLLLATAPLHGLASARLVALLCALLVLRIALWFIYRARLGERIAPRANAALDAAGRWLQAAGTAAPLVLLLAVLAWPVPPVLKMPALVLAGLFAWGAGAWMKYVLITRAAFNQGFALKHLPVRGVRR
jgi:phenylacetyl-CoA:acceptor oxidoreductase subunit 2